MFGSDDRLSWAASAILNSRQADPMSEWAVRQCSELGPVIWAQRQLREFAALAECGFTPGSYNAELRRRLCGDEYPRMSYRIFGLLSLLEVEACEHCGGGVEVRTAYTPMLGGGYDTMTRCLDCGHVDVAT